jgi:hypothetical protein
MGFMPSVPGVAPRAGMHTPRWGDGLSQRDTGYQLSQQDTRYQLSQRDTAYQPRACVGYLSFRY